MRLPPGIGQRSVNRRRRALSRALWSLPADSRQAMLRALEHEELIAGAYADRCGRICPMMAAFRHGARSGVGAFPDAWDDFTRARRPRPATRREQEILRALLEESLAHPIGPNDRPPATVGPQPVSERRPVGERQPGGERQPVG